MRRITVIAFGTLKEKYWKDAMAEYLKRIGGFCRIQLIELPETPLPETPNQKEIKSALEKEAQRVYARIPTHDHIIALCPEGTCMKSHAFAAYLENKAVHESVSGFTFLIGSSHGLAEQLKKEASFRLSFGPMTFPHQLFRIMLAEQIYRAFTILHGTAYHK